jgi:DNA-directed RNA polymerase subunit K/omega
MDIDEQAVVEKVFENSVNDYATVLAIARRARQILDDYPKYEDLLENEKATVLALEEFVGGQFSFHPAEAAATDDEP